MEIGLILIISQNENIILISTLFYASNTSKKASRHINGQKVFQ